MNPCDLTHYVPMQQAIWELVLIAVGAFVTGVSVGIFFTVAKQEKGKL